MAATPKAELSVLPAANTPKATNRGCAKAHQDLMGSLAARRPTLLRQARRMLRDQAAAEDATQDAMLQALRNIESYRGDAQLGTWLYRVGANAVLMTMRRERRVKERHSRASAASEAIPAAWLHGTLEPTAPDTEVETAQQAQLLRWAVEQLPEHYRNVVLLCDLDERPLEEVAESLGLTIGGVRTRRLRAHRLLRQSLGARASELRPS